MMLLEKLDDAQPMSKLIRESKRKTGKPLPSELLKHLIDADNELWWWCDIIHSKVKPHDNSRQKGRDLRDHQLPTSNSDSS